MIKGFHTHFIPHPDNEHKPRVLRHPSLFAIAIGLLILQLAFHVFGLNVSRVGASTTITVSKITQLTNLERSRYGRPALSYNNALAIAARNKGAHMIQNNYWSHTAPDGTTPWYWILHSGYDYLYAGENLAKDFVDTRSVVAAWMASPAHRNNILSGNFQDIGVAVIEGNLNGHSTILVVQMFGQSRTTQRAAPSTLPSTITPSTVDRTPPEAPTIISPENQSYINTSQPDITGETEKSSTVTVYDEENNLGSVPADTEGAFSFRPEEKLKDGEHGFNADATDASGNTSERSSKITVTIDTVPPKIIEDSLKIDRSKDKLGERFEIMIHLEERTETVLVNIGDYSAVLEATKCEIETAQIRVQAQEDACNIYFGDLIPPAKTLQKSKRKAEIVAMDKAGNTDTYKFDLPTPILKSIGLTSSPFFQNLLQNSPSTLINAILAFIILGLFIVDSVIIYRKGVLRKNSHSSAQTLILILGILTMLFLQNGNII